MAWQCILGIIIMVASFIGVLVAAKVRMQPVAMGCTVLMLVGLGMYAWFYMNPPPDLSYQVYGKAVAQKTGETLKAAGLSSATLVTADTSSEYSKEYLQIMKDAFGGSIEVVTPATGEDGGMIELTNARLKEIIKTASADSVIILDVNMMDASKVDFLKGAYKGPKFFITANGSIMGAKIKAIANAMKKGNLIGAVVYVDSTDPDFKPSDSDLAEAFNKRYVVVNADNFDQYKEKFGF